MEYNPHPWRSFCYFMLFYISLSFLVVIFYYLYLTIHSSLSQHIFRSILVFLRLNYTRIHAQRICRVKEAIMKSTITATCQALLCVCVCVCEWYYVLRVLLKLTESRIEALLCRGFLIATTVMEPQGAASLPQQVTVLTFELCLRLAATLAYWNLHTQVLSCFLCSLFLWKVESFHWLISDGAEIHSELPCCLLGWRFDESL